MEDTIPQPGMTGVAPSVTMRETLPSLDDATASARLLEEGPNEVDPPRERTTWQLLLGSLREPMLLLLLLGGGVYALLGQPLDAGVLGASAVLIVALATVQRRRTERAVVALRVLSAPRCAVIRGGEQHSIAARELVSGDLIFVREGERIPADGVLLDAAALEVDESLLTGESAPVAKVASQRPITSMADAGAAALHAGTLVTTGEGFARVLATGPRAALGRLASQLAHARSKPSPLQRETRRLVRVLGALGVLACAVVVVAYGVSRGGAARAWYDGLLVGLALAMSMLPEEMPVVLAVFSALGAWRLAKVNVLTRDQGAIETLGTADVLCVDKTGTLTENQMTLSRTFDAAGGELRAADPQRRRLLQLAELASRLDTHDPMDCAIQRACADLERPHTKPVKEYPLRSELPCMSIAWADGAGRHLVASKGAPEAVATLCRLAPVARAALLEAVARLGDQGLRVLAVASAQVIGPLPTEHGELRLELAGLLGFVDPLKASASEVIERCRGAGVRIVMLTGDGAATARHVARAAGLAGSDAVMLGAEIEHLDEATLTQRARDTTIFARVLPAHKLRIVHALQADGHVVAMTGDGVNDAPALEAAHIGVAMGKRGTDVAREAASMVLLDDELSSLVAGIEIGRRIDANLQKAARFVVAAHVAIVALSVLPALHGAWPLLLLPAHIAVLELVIDPTCAVVFEVEPAPVGAMQRPPRPPSTPLFSLGLVRDGLIRGVCVLGSCALVLLVARAGHDEGGVRGLVFTTLLISLLRLVKSLRDGARAPNPPLRWLSAAAVVLLALALLTPIGRVLFHVASLSILELGLAALVGLVPLELHDRIVHALHARAER